MLENDKRFEIATYDNSRDLLYKYREQGALRGVYLGFPDLHEIYTMALGSSTEWTGTPQSGKSEVLLEKLLNTSLFYGWKHLMYVPDIGKKEVVIAKLIHKISGKTFDKRFVNSNYISESEIERHLQWILEHFFIITRKDNKKKITPYEFWDLAVEIKHKHGLHTATIDSWKDMRRYVGRDGEPIHRDDLYLEDVLEYRNTLSEEHNLHFHIIIHPLKTEMDSNGKRKPPHPYDLKGGTTWFDSGKCQITIHRIDGSQNGFRFIVYKGKPETVATIGECTMYYDAKLSRIYTEGPDGKEYADPQYKSPKARLLEKQSLHEDDDEDDEQLDLPF